MKIYCISGLGADKRVFNYLTLDAELISIDWIIPNDKETIESYAQRLIEIYQLDQENDFAILGVSFGGLVAVEISKRIQPGLTILISSVETKNELNSLLKLVGKTKILNVVPNQAFNPPKLLSHFLFGTKNKVLLNSILHDTDLKFAKWCVKELVNWKNETRLNNVLKISGTRDKLLRSKDKNAVLVDKGEHFMIVDRASEISQIINLKLNEI
ncbi:MAG: alpha/beta hydrolase [Crocinitomicaceae bacterium]